MAVSRSISTPATSMFAVGVSGSSVSRAAAAARRCASCRRECRSPRSRSSRHRRIALLNGRGEEAVQTSEAAPARATRRTPRRATRWTSRLTRARAEDRGAARGRAHSAITLAAQARKQKFNELIYWSNPKLTALTFRGLNGIFIVLVVVRATLLSIVSTSPHARHRDLEGVHRRAPRTGGSRAGAGAAAVRQAAGQRAPRPTLTSLRVR